MSNRTNITNHIVEQLRKIDGYNSPFSADYVFMSNLHSNVYRGVKYIDEINDFPSLYVTSNVERRKYQTNYNTESIVFTVIRCYVMGDDTELQLSNIFQDIEHVLYNMQVPNEFTSLDITIDTTITDSGLLEPYGMAEIFLSSRFEI
jgi:hypothetical protein